MAESAAEREIAALRRFNRFYTQRIGVLEEGLTGSDFTLAEARVIYEIAHRDGATAGVLGRDLGLDAGYLSRILARLAKARLVERSHDATDRRQRPLRLSARGRKAFAGLDGAAKRQMTGLLAPLDMPARTALIDAMERIERLLGEAAAAPEIVLRAPRPGDLGWVVHRHGALYAAEYGWDASFETMVARIVADYARDHDPAHEACWIAEAGGRVMGSVFLVRESETVGRLRLLYVEREARGFGVGRRLVETCIEFARSTGYRTLTLWTNDILTAARRIYEAAGFTLVKEEPHRSFGKDLVGQYWRLEL